MFSSTYAPRRGAEGETWVRNFSAAARRRRPDDQDLQAQCLTLLTNAVVCWNTVYLDAAINHLTQNGATLDAAHPAPLTDGR